VSQKLLAKLEVGLKEVSTVCVKSPRWHLYLHCARYHRKLPPCHKQSVGFICSQCNEVRCR